MHTIDSRINRRISHDLSGIASVRYRGGFEDWNEPETFVIQMEEALGFDPDRGCTVWSPVARIEHLRPHDLFDPGEGIHLDVYRRADPISAYETVDFNASLARGEPKSVFFSLLCVFEIESNVETLLGYYLGRRNTIPAGDITLPERLMS